MVYERDSHRGGLSDATAPAVDPYAVAVRVGAAAIGGGQHEERVARAVLDAAGPLLKQAWSAEWDAAVVAEVTRLRGQLDDLTSSWWNVLHRITADVPSPSSSRDQGRPWRGGGVAVGRLGRQVRDGCGGAERLPGYHAAEGGWVARSTGDANTRKTGSQRSRSYGFKKFPQWRGGGG